MSRMGVVAVEEEEKQNLLVDELIVMDIVKKYKKRKLRILIANDDMFNLNTICSMLGFLTQIGQIDKATNGQEAFEKVRNNEQPNNNERAYDIIFLDLDMPIKNGYEACSMIINHYKQIKEERELLEKN